MRRKIALVLAMPMVLAMLFGGLRFNDELSRARNYNAAAAQVTVLGPAVDFLDATERAGVVARANGPADKRTQDAVATVQALGKKLRSAAADAQLTSAQKRQLDSVWELSAQLRDGDAYVSLNSISLAVRQLHRGISALVDTIVRAQVDPDTRFQTLRLALDGRLSLAMQQTQLAYQIGEGGARGGTGRRVQFVSEVGVEGAAIDRLAAALGAQDPQIVTLRQQHAGRIQGTSTSDGRVKYVITTFGASKAEDAYDTITADLLTTIDDHLSSAAGTATNLALLNGLITLLALLATVALALLVVRMLVRPIQKVREGALLVANDRLPAAVAALRAGEEPGEIEPIDVHTHEELGQMARAVDDLHRQALHLAAGEAELRSQVGQMFVTLSRRNTSLVNQQLSLIERLERDEEDPSRLESLFRLDHLASRMRRTSDSLMILADARGKTSAQDVLSVNDALHAATAGVSEYQRVHLSAAPEAEVMGVAAADVVHLLTELIDNALTYSPPTAPVRVASRRNDDQGVTIVVEDSGLGMTDEQIESHNLDLSTGGEITADTTRRMGVLVVSRIAQRHGIDVTLSHRDGGGTVATVVLPPTLIEGAVVPEADAEVDEADEAGFEPAAPVDGAAIPAEELLTPEEPVDDEDEDDSVATVTPITAALQLDEPATPRVTNLSALAGLPLRGRNGHDAAAEADDQVADEAAWFAAEEEALDGPAVPEDEPEPVEHEVAEDEPVAEVVEAKPATPAKKKRRSLFERRSQEEATVADTTDEALLSRINAAIMAASASVPAPPDPVAPEPSSWLDPDAIPDAWDTDGSDAWRELDAVPVTTHTTDGLPLRSPGDSAMPAVGHGTSTVIARDPDAIRARLSAHRAGVHRGRHGSVVDEATEELQNEEVGQA